MPCGPRHRLCMRAADSLPTGHVRRAVRNPVVGALRDIEVPSSPEVRDSPHSPRTERSTAARPRCRIVDAPAGSRAVADRNLGGRRGEAAHGTGPGGIRRFWVAVVRPQPKISRRTRPQRRIATRDVGGDLVAFISEIASGSVMRGIPRTEWERGGMSDDHGAHSPTRTPRNASQRWRSASSSGRASPRRLAAGWRRTVQASILVVPAVLRAFTERAGGDVVIGALPRIGHSCSRFPGRRQDARFRHRATQAYREAIAPCTSELLVTNGATITASMM